MKRWIEIALIDLLCLVLFLAIDFILKVFGLSSIDAILPSLIVAVLTYIVLQMITKPERK